MYPLGASYDGAGVNFALFSQVAQKVELCLFDEEDRETRVEMTEQNSYVWHNYLPGPVSSTFVRVAASRYIFSSYPCL